MSASLVLPRHSLQGKQGVVPRTSCGSLFTVRCPVWELFFFFGVGENSPSPDSRIEVAHGSLVSITNLSRMHLST